MCLCYINQEIGTEEKELSEEKNEYSQNFVAVGCLKGAIQIWDLDVLGKTHFLMDLRVFKGSYDR